MKWLKTLLLCNWMIKTRLAERPWFGGCFLSGCAFPVDARQHTIYSSFRRNPYLSLTPLVSASRQALSSHSSAMGSHQPHVQTHSEHPLLLRVCLVGGWVGVGFLVFFPYHELNISLHVHPRLLGSPSCWWQTHLPHSLLCVWLP